MAVIRVNKTRDYTVMSNTHFKDRSMSLKAKGLLSLMLSLPDDWDYSEAGLTVLSKDGKDSVKKGLKELEDLGYLVRTQAKNEKGQWAGYIYDIYETPQSVNPITKQPSAENPSTENKTQYITNKNKVKNNQKINKSNKNEYENNKESFIPPTIEEVAAYCQENDINVSPQRFVDYYTANGWKVGRNPMKDWKAAVRTWRANTWETKEKTSKPKIDIVPTSELMEEAKNKEAIKCFADFAKDKLGRDLTADELEEIENTVFNDTIEVVNHVITILSEKPTDNFNVLCELYREESMSYYLGINYN